MAAAASPSSAASSTCLTQTTPSLAKASASSALTASAVMSEGSEDVVAGMRLFWHLSPLRGNRPEPAGLVVLEGAHELGPRVHHEGAVCGDRLPDRLAAEHQYVELLARAVHPALSSEREHLAWTE